MSPHELRPKSIVLPLAVLLACVALAPSPAAAGAGDSPLGGEAPGFRLATLDGGAVDLAQLSGKIVVVHFATTWCPFCNVEAPHLERLYRTYRDRGVEVLIVDVGEDPELIRGWRDRWQLTLPVLLDADGAVAASYAPADTLPDLPRDQVMIASNLLIDREGRIRFFSLLDTKAFDAKLVELTARLEKVLAEDSEVGCSGTTPVERLPRIARLLAPHDESASCSL